MAIDTKQFFNNKFGEQQVNGSALAGFRKKGLELFNHVGIPPVKHEEWKYTRVNSLFNDGLRYDLNPAAPSAADIEKFRLPHTVSATSLFFINGVYNESLSEIKHAAKDLVILPLETAAAGEYSDLVEKHLGHSASYHPDGIHALNAAFTHGGVFILAKKNRLIEEPVYIYHITDSRGGFTFAQPRILVYAEKQSQVQLVEYYGTLGNEGSFTNEVIEIVAEEASVVDYYKIQHEGAEANHVGTTHVRQLGKCLTNAVTISLSGGLIRNNLNMIMESEHGESHMYGLYLLNGKTHVDNHTIVDNVQPHCFSNELYKGIMDEKSTGVFNGKIFVRQDAQKTNAYQSNKNILLGDSANVNTKPQLEIFADDVKCSHGCTIGRLDEEALFYLRTRGISEKNAKSLLLHAFAVDILENIKPQSLKAFVDQIISERLDFNF
ncbi:Fe-S cluster assembly protein SufD [Pollutibacter soli]|uniref:Fe-S cluster assembly protein SufD n=1 Tax=Pollutibacter soli TaxID=3034157 RepID=UPI0030135593